ncbi:MAG TPA: family 1 glycosylhydrolase [Flavisolibacter sp.]|jgi:dTDP-4-dehydrorhamnose reductase|nr:family 1 glycosylhydrolase [Flavisolibacter sp.]
MNKRNEIEIWGGIECTINRVGNQYFDQSEYSGHYKRGAADIDLVSSLGVSMLRYPVLWERHQPEKGQSINWSFAETNLNRMRELDITPIAGLVHHGSGHRYVNFFDGSFEQGLAEYATKVAQRFPWIEYYTPVNEPLTTARFCGLYGHWYPHMRGYHPFFKVLLSECKATVMAMKAIREINPAAKLIQTEDLGKCHSTPLLQYQAAFENERRWLSYELLCGTLTPDKVMYQFMVKKGIPEEELQWFLENNCRPHIAGFNYYLTSERYLDEDMAKYPEEFHGGNQLHAYADVHTVHVPMKEKACGPAALLKEAWERLQLPLAITECHLHSTREDQMRWFHQMWETVHKVKEEGVDFRAITAWAIFGLTGWNRLCTEPGGVYEPGVFNVSTGCPKPTALARLLQELTKHQVYYHPVLEAEGWWQRDTRQQYGAQKVVTMRRKRKPMTCQPLLILGKTGTLGKAFGLVSQERNIHHLLLSRQDLDITNRQKMAEVIRELNPWGIVNAAGYVNVDKAEEEADTCLEANCHGAAALASLCKEHRIRFLSFSTDLVFDGQKQEPYTESDEVHPLNVYGRSKAEAERMILQENEDALLVRTSSFFGPWDSANFVATTLAALREDLPVKAAADVYVTPTYVPDLVHACLDLMLDGDAGIVHISNGEVVSWAQLAKRVAVMAGYDVTLVQGVRQQRMGWTAQRPSYSALQSEKGICMPHLQNALERFFEAQENLYRSGRIAV